MKHGPRTILLKLLTILLSGSPFRWWTRQQLTAGLIPQQSQLRKSTLHVQHLSRAINARTVELAGTNQFQMFATVSIKKFPQEYLDQVISNPAARTATGACTWSGPQAPSVKLSNQPVQASSDKHQAPSSKHQASSLKLQAPRSLSHGTWILEKF